MNQEIINIIIIIQAAGIIFSSPLLGFIWEKLAQKDLIKV